MADNYTLDDYLCHDKGLLLPLVNEYTWPVAWRAGIYLVGLLWCFLGVAIVADVFMCAIEKITSRTHLIKVASATAESGFDEYEVKVWNDTVANLTLMALGSSAPEILLSCIEIVGGNFKSGSLGPSTIVGSAAFNLLVITAVCIVSIPSPDVRCIRAIKVFGVTAFGAVFAYIWLIVILVWRTPNEVELWEAILTFMFFPVLVIVAYVADKDFCKSQPPESDNEVELGLMRKLTDKRKTGLYEIDHLEAISTSDIEGQGFDPRMNQQKMREFVKEVARVNPHLGERELATLAAHKIADEQPHGHLWYRINAARALGGNTRLVPNMSEPLQETLVALKSDIYDMIGEPSDETTRDYADVAVDLTQSGTRAVIEFTASQSAVLEQEKRVRVGIKRYGRTNHRVMVKIETIDGSATANSDYIPVKEVLVFEKDEVLKHVDIEIVDDNEWEPDEVFFVKLAIDVMDMGEDSAVIGRKAIQEITIIDDDEPGMFEFAKPSMLFKESAGRALIPVERSNGADGKVELSWKTEDMNAKAGKDYEAGEGVLVFEHGETTKTIEVILHDDQEAEKDECFKVILIGVTGGGKLGRIHKSIITIVNDDDFNGMVNRLVNLTNTNMDAMRIDSGTWGEQFVKAMNVNGGDLENATSVDYIMHFLTFGWKLIFAMIPPPSIWNGWLSFFVALAMIGMLTAIIGDLASIFGCLVGLKDSVTAITFVALGTSLPDLFASKQAAVGEKTADNSIGNVMGSNSVNVFLGLGLPWLMAAIYWSAKGEKFPVPAGSLSFSVACYTIAAVIAIIILMLRRNLAVFGKAELGGTYVPKIVVAVIFIILWFSYIMLSSLQAYDHIGEF